MIKLTNKSENTKKISTVSVIRKLHKIDKNSRIGNSKIKLNTNNT